MSDNYFRLVPRSDFDGLVCAVLLKELDMIDDIKFAHPKDMQDGTILISDTDITTNLPNVEGVRLAFDHHSSEITRVEDKKDNYINDPQAPSAARVVYDRFGGKKKFPNISDDMMEAVDKGDSAQFSEDEIVDAKGWALLNYLMDSRTGLGQFREFRVSNYNLMMQLIDFCRDHTVDDIFDLPDVKEQIKRGTTAHGNRFMIYALLPDTNISIHVLWGLNKLNTVFATGKSIINRTSKTNIGDLMLKYGGGGHESAGTCQIENDDAERVLSELIEQITADG